MPTSVSERLAQEDHILHEIRAALSMCSSVGLATPRRKGAVYASSPITSGARLYVAAYKLGVSVESYRTDHPAEFQKCVMQPNLRDGVQFGDQLQGSGWPLVIVPAMFFSSGWTQEHYMSLWRQVIVRFARRVAFNYQWHWSTGCVEEFLIAVQSRKSMMFREGGAPLSPRIGGCLVRQAIDGIDHMGFDTKPMYDLWRQLDLTIDAMHPKQKTS